MAVRRHGDPRPDGQIVAALTPPPLIDSFRRIGVDSQNLAAELILRRLNAALDASAPDAISAMLTEAGIAPGSAELADGSGLSVHNRITPRAAVRLLLWADRQSWREDWRSAFPSGGESGTLARRFQGTALEGRILAKTGTFAA